jgi:hypothetical protein
MSMTRILERCGCGSDGIPGVRDFPVVGPAGLRPRYIGGAKGFCVS